MGRKASTLQVIEQANVIIREYRAQHLSLSLRSLWYQFVSRNLMLNDQRRYSGLGRTVDKAKWDKLIPWDAIEDYTRYLREPPTWESPTDALEELASQFCLPLWRETQNYHPEVWIEKDALVGVIEGICERRRVPYMSLRGYSSGTTLWKAAERFKGLIEEGIKPIVLLLVDCDPSGRRMIPDLEARLGDLAGCKIEVKHLGLTEDQALEHALPPNLVKDSDSRSREYIEEIGEDCWELDALSPLLIESLIEDAINDVFDPEAWALGEREEQECRKQLRSVVLDFSPTLEKAGMSFPWEPPPTVTAMAQASVVIAEMIAGRSRGNGTLKRRI